MKETGPEAVPPPESFSRLERRLEKFVPVPEPYLKSMPSVFARSRMDSMLSETQLIKQAEHWGRASMPTLNQTGELKAIFWWTSKMQKFVVEDIRVVVGREVAHVLAPFGDGVRDPADELLDAALALFGAHHAVEVFGDHDVGGGLRPGLRDLDVFLLEDHLAFFIGDVRRNAVPTRPHQKDEHPSC